MPTTLHHLHAAIAAQLSHPPGSLADGLTESLCEQALTQPADLDALRAQVHADAQAAGLPTGWRWTFLYASTLIGAMLAAHYWPRAWFS